ncbi:putative NAC domain-containing protein 94 isoform X2 [Pistacia vera]|uniref:putative NAC domain-containing protein 94 isoform X2 n=1 Tax=Pistacia vera TaxID=55513 RepID=UPI001262E851|nr:putative NAC domain-containing protein 94 isoform X2 [Pistacia vera]
MGSLVGLMYHLFRVKIITLLTEKRVHPDLFVPEINEVDIYQFDPYDLPALSETKSDDQVWYFFCEPHYKYANSKRAHRATGGGNWKITGRGCDVKDKGRVIGKKRTLVFCRRGSTSKEIKTDWVMHEFYIEDSPYYEVESQQTMSQHLISDSRKHITENSFLDVESPPLSSDELESIYSMINPQPPDEFDAVSGYNWLNHSSVSALQSPINQYQGSNSSYSNGISNDCNLGSYEFTGGLEDVVNSQRNVQNQYPCEVVLTQSDIEAMVKELS